MGRRAPVLLLAALALTAAALWHTVGRAPALQRLVTGPAAPLAPLAVAVVEEHHHAVRYWVRHATRPTTVLHIDAHSDLGLPSDITGVAANPAQMTQGTAQRTAESLARSNDDFIVAAALTGWVRRLVWVWPAWLPAAWWPGGPGDDGGRPRRPRRSQRHYGTTKPLHHRPCVCTVAPPNGSLSDCLAMNSVGDEVPIGDGACTPNVPWTLNVTTLPLPTGAFRLPLGEGERYILDIDEDFFGVEAPYLQLQDAGIPVAEVNRLLEAALCPSTEAEEQAMDEVLSSAVHTVLVSDDAVRYDWAALPLLLQRALRAADIQPCPAHPDRLHDQLAAFVQYLRQNVTQGQRRLLRAYGFCRDREGSGFLVVCVGFSSAGDRDQARVALHSSDRLAVAQQLQALEWLLQNVTHPPVLVTVARSVKDGYTPRDLWAYVEARLLHVLRRAAGRWGRALEVQFDDRLWGGSAGCVGRPLAVFPLPALLADP